MVGSSPAGSVHAPTGLKLIFRCLELVLLSRLHEPPCSSMAVTRCESDMLALSAVRGGSLRAMESPTPSQACMGGERAVGSG